MVKPVSFSPLAQGDIPYYTILLIVMRNGVKKTIVIFGSSQPQPGSVAYECAYQLGRSLGQAGYEIANGGYGGTMAAAARGAQETGVKTTGVTCEAFGRGKSNPWISKEIHSKTLTQRLDKLVDLADAYVVLPGGTGTLLELAYCWEMINKHFLPARPIICLGDYWKPMVDTMVNSGEANDEAVFFVDTPLELLDRLNNILPPVRR